MARVTVEDCIDKIPNRFELVMLAAQRARDLSVGVEITVDRDNDKNPVVALREIADETVNLDDLTEGLVLSMQKHADIDDPEDDADLLAMEEALAASAETAAGETVGAEPADVTVAAEAEGEAAEASEIVEIDTNSGDAGDKEAD